MEDIAKPENMDKTSWADRERETTQDMLNDNASWIARDRETMCVHVFINIASNAELGKNVISVL